jgi:hypothetical protein
MKSSELRAQVAAFDVMNADLAKIEREAAEHRAEDQRQHKQLGDGMADLHHKLDFIINMQTVLQDQMVEGFRALGARVKVLEAPKRGTNGR